MASRLPLQLAGQSRSDALGHYLDRHQSSFWLSVKRYDPVRYLGRLGCSAAVLKEVVLSSQRVKTLIKEFARANTLSEEEVTSRVATIVNDMGHVMNVGVARWVVFPLSVLAKRIFTTIEVNVDGMQKLRDMVPQMPIVLMPTHRSYVDFMLVSMMCFAYELPLPVIAAGEDFKHMKIIGSALRRCGAFYIRRSFSEDVLYRTIFSEYVQTTIADGHNALEFFIEGTRSRTGKSLHPRLGMMKEVLNPYFRAAISDIALFPITISYEHLLEEDLHVLSMLGVQKVKESTKSMLNGISNVVGRNNERICIHIAEPMSVHELCKGRLNRKVHSLRSRCEDFAKLLRSPTSDVEVVTGAEDTPYQEELAAERALVHDISYSLMGRLQQHILVYPRSLIATVLLQSQLPIHIATLTDEVVWLRDQLRGLGNFQVIWPGKTVMEAQQEVMKGLRLISPPVSLNRQEVTISQVASFPTRPGTSVLQLCRKAAGHEGLFNRACVELQLVYPMNQLMHAVGQPAIFAAVLSLYPGGVSSVEAFQDYAVVNAALHREFVFSKESPEQVKEDFISTAHQLHRLHVITVSNPVDYGSSQRMKAAPSGEKLLDFMTRIIAPMLEVVWVFAISMLRLAEMPGGPVAVTFGHALQLAQDKAIECINKGLVVSYRTIGEDLLKTAMESLLKHQLLERQSLSSGAEMVRVPAEKIALLKSMASKLERICRQVTVSSTQCLTRQPHRATSKL